MCFLNVLGVSPSLNLSQIKLNDPEVGSHTFIRPNNQNQPYHYVLPLQMSSHSKYYSV